MPIDTLDKLQYSEDRKGPFRIYVYRKDGRGYELRTFFEKTIKYPDEEVDIPTAKAICDRAMAKHQEVRVTDGGDMLVYHSQDGMTLYGGKFWEEIQ